MAKTMYLHRVEVKFDEITYQVVNFAVKGTSREILPSSKAICQHCKSRPNPYSIAVTITMSQIILMSATMAS